jgi:hypothetical protein
MEVYIVKSFVPENGWVNLQAFDNNDAAVSFANTVEKQIPNDVFFENEFVEIEVLNVRSW